MQGSVFLRPNPLHFVPMVSKASYNGCDQRIIIVYSRLRKYLSAYYEKQLCHVLHKTFQNFTSNEMQLS